MLFSILFINNAASAQPQTLAELETALLESLHIVRDFANKQGDVAPLRELLKDYEPEEAYYLMVCGLSEGLLKGADKYVIQEKMDKKFEYSDYNFTIDSADLAIIQENAYMAMLIVDHVVGPVPKLPLSRTSNWLDEIAFYDIRPGQRVLDVGTGKGSFGLILSNIYPTSDFILNDIDTALVQVLSEMIASYRASTKRDNIYLSFGDEKRTHVRGKVDKIIMRSTFHHLTEVDAMLTDMKRLMTPNSTLYIHERTKRRAKCPYAMHERDIRKIMRRHGFKVVDEFAKKKDYILAYRLAN